MTREQAMATAEGSDIVTSRIWQHLSERGSPASTTDQRRTNETGRNVIPKTHHWSALSFPQPADPNSDGTDVSQDGRSILTISLRISSISTLVRTCPTFVELAA